MPCGIHEIFPRETVALTHHYRFDAVSDIISLSS